MKTVFLDNLITLFSIIYTYYVSSLKADDNWIH
jgi:hypothetical protein